MNCLVQIVTYPSCDESGQARQKLTVSTKGSASHFVDISGIVY